MNKIEFIALIRHIAWVGYQMGVGQKYNEQPTDDQLRSLMSGVKVALNNPNLTPEGNHVCWMTQKIDDGWKYGKNKSVKNKTHPDMVDYWDLPEVERRKDDMDIVAQKYGERLFSRLVTDAIEL